MNSYSLTDLLRSVRTCLEVNFQGRYWVRAETSDVRRSGGGGHCYLELLDKSPSGGIEAKVRATIWSHVYNAIDRKLKDAGLSSLSSGMGILALVQVSFHEQYGLALSIIDLDPSYSLGELARVRLQTIERLKREEVIDLNRRLTLPRSLQRLAIVSSSTAAGLGDFVHQLRGNRYQLQFYPCLFSAQMQGEGSPRSIISALERVRQHREAFDAVVIIRGGGAVSELRAFDDYALCYYCTQYPLPILCGIGHERDESVLDLVAHTSLKTPTAVAEYLIHRQLEELSGIERLSTTLSQTLSRLSVERHRTLDNIALRLPRLVSGRLGEAHQRQERLRERLGLASRALVARERQELSRYTTLLGYVPQRYLLGQGERLRQLQVRLRPQVAQHLQRHLQQVERYAQAIRLAHPDNILARGFAVVSLADGTIVTDGARLQKGDVLKLRLGKASPVSVEVK